MAAANSINESTTGVTGFTGTGFTGSPVTQHYVLVGGASSSTITSINPSTAGFVLTSNGAADPTFQAPAGGSVVVQQVRTSKTSTQTATTTIAAITTQPTSSTGTSVLSLSITPTDASNILLIEGNVVCTSAGNFVTAYLIQGGTGDGFGVAWQSGSAANLPLTIPIRYYKVAGGTSSITFDIYAATVSSGSTFINSNTSGTALSGTDAFTSLMITELTP